jgi:hypothetical protein
VGARQTADLAELKDWVEGLRAAAHTARQKGNITLAQALDITRFEVYESYLEVASGLHGFIDQRGQLLGLVEHAHGLIGDLIHHICRSLRELGASDEVPRDYKCSRIGREAAGRSAVCGPRSVARLGA